MNFFEMLVLVHFIADWIFQTHKQASEKSKDLKVLLEHSAIYTIFFIPVLVFGLSSQLFSLFWILPLLFVSHAFLDNRKFELWLFKKFKGIFIISGCPFYKIKGEPVPLDMGLFWIVFITIDQIFHMIILAFIALVL